MNTIANMARRVSEQMERDFGPAPVPGCKDTAARLAVEGVGSGYGAPTHANDNVPVAAQPARTIYDLPFGVVYLGSPYSLYKHGLHMAARHASRAAAALMMRGFIVYSPIAHGHACASVSDLPQSWTFWKAQCQPYIDAASSLVVLKLEGWQDSVGLTYEIEEFGQQGKPVVYVGMDDLRLREETIEDEWKRRVG